MAGVSRGWRFVVRTVGAVLVTASLLVGCGKAASTGAAPTPTARASFPVTMTDDDGTAVTIDAAPRRIVTFAPSLTETMFALGLGDRVVGVSGSFDDYPPQATSLPHVGDANLQPDAEKVVALRPDLVLIGFAGYQQAEHQLRDLGLTVFASISTDFDDLLHDVRTLGTVTGARAAAARLADGLRARAASIQRRAAAEQPVSCFFDDGLYAGAISTVGPGSLIFDLLKRAGCDPVTSGAKGAYPQWSAEQVVKADPAVYLVASEAVASTEAIVKRAGFASLAAVQNSRVYIVNSDLVSRPGPRVVEGLDALARDLHPGAFG